MAKKEELIGACRYYNGEKDCPYERGSDAFSFWSFEKMFVKQATDSPGLVDFYTRKVEKYIDSHPKEKNTITSEDVDILTKCIIFFSEELLSKWCPTRVDIIFRY